MAGHWLLPTTRNCSCPLGYSGLFLSADGLNSLSYYVAGGNGAGQNKEKAGFVCLGCPSKTLPRIKTFG